jgi:hypothetical protein
MDTYMLMVHSDDFAFCVPELPSHYLHKVSFLHGKGSETILFLQELIKSALE